MPVSELTGATHLSDLVASDLFPVCLVGKKRKWLVTASWPKLLSKAPSFPGILEQKIKPPTTKKWQDVQTQAKQEAKHSTLIIIIIRNTPLSCQATENHIEYE